MTRHLRAIAILVALGVLGNAFRAEADPFTTVGEGWDGPGLGSAELSFYLGLPTPDLPLALQHAALIAALDVWGSTAALTFTETFSAGQPRSLDFNFQTGGFSPGILAFAFFPAPPNSEPIAGDVFFNEDFTWEVGNDLGFAAFDLVLIAVHEIGHSLGLNHSTTANAVMRPFVSSGDVFDGLHTDDIAGIESLYAAVPVPEPSTLTLVSAGLIALASASRRLRKERNQWKRREVDA
jgi:hypothetical protein